MSNESQMMKRKRKSEFKMVHESKKKRAHLEMFGYDIYTSGIDFYSSGDICFFAYNVYTFGMGFYSSGAICFSAYDVYTSDINFYSSGDVYFSGYDFYTSGIGFYSSGGVYAFGDLDSISTISVLVSDVYFYSLFFIIYCIEACPLIISMSTGATCAGFNKQSACAKSITEIMKEHFVEAHASLGKILDRIKNLWYVEFGKRYRWDRLHEHDILDAWEKWASLHYKDLMYEVKYQELKMNTEHHHIETSLPIPTDKQLMFEVAGGSNKGHVYGFGSQFTAITAEQWGSSSSLHREGEEVGGDTSSMQRTSSQAS
ncbi:hypothetical protein M9H77_23748 [Catharanthus roseus]|uniref:Uncharacterized protein n=1 Tax=Catharanthus roseus TaxID=4058 RepID=A0ACC0AVQ2_CATRO|nr:hypothetical protein M9H77_23748 [Catharanthus roseus]